MNNQKILRKGIVKNKDSGITLIALVVTIIVLLILAGISIMMLTGQNGILNRTGEAKEKTSEGQIREEIALAWNSVQTDGIINNWDNSKKAEELQKELRKEDSTSTVKASGNSLTVNYKGYEAVINTESGSFTKFAKKDSSSSKDTITLSFNQIETESRAIILEVTAEIEGGTTPTEESLQSLSQEELQPMFVKACQSLGAPFASWNDISRGNSDMTVEDAYNNFSFLALQGYKSAYDLIIKTESYGGQITFTCNGETITGAKAEFVITSNGNYTVTASKGDDTGTDTATVTKCLNNGEEEKYAYPADKTRNYTLTKDGYDVVIPAGFAYGTSANVGTVTTGLVITDNIDEETGHSMGNEFVWIPVDKDNLTVGKTDKAMASKTTGTDTKGNDNYQGTLYDFSETTSTANSTYVQGTNNYREPDVVSDYDGGSYDTVGITSAGMQEDYNAMIASIKKYGGFYVARYELGKGNNISKLGVDPTSSYEEETRTWYGLYAQAQSYTKSSVVSSMIWGSQYDAMLNFALASGNDSSKVTANTNGNHGERVLKTGTTRTSDAINNVFDLEGNMFEETREACGTNSRVFRGGSFLANGFAPATRFDVYEGLDRVRGNICSRATLYIK